MTYNHPNTDDHVHFGAIAGVNIKTAPWCGLNVTTDEEYAGALQAMRLESQFPPNQEWQFPTNGGLIDGVRAQF
jgi:hypothetical protein